MTPITATLSGSLGIRAGLNRESITLDLAAIPDDALTVAIKGDNGQGKSTILNLAMTPFREPPQIAGNIYDQFGPSGLRELIWSHAGVEYWSRIEYKQTAKTKSQKATIKVKTGDAWTPVTLPDHTTSDGKSSTYDACLEHILGPQDLYFLAAFRAQNAPKLAEHSDPKGLMRALLALDEPAELSERARDVARELKRHHAVVKDQAAALDSHAERVTALETAIREISAGHAARAEAKLTAIDAAARAKAELERALSGDLDRQRLIEQRAAVTARLKEASEAATAARASADNALAAAKRRHMEAQKAGQDRHDALTADLSRALARIHSAEATLANKAAIEQAEADAGMLAAQIDGQTKTLEAQREQVEGLRALAAQIQTLEAMQTRLASFGKSDKTRLDELTARAGFVAIVPCHGEGEYAACPALAEAQAAQGRIAEAQAAVTARREEWKAITATIKDLSAHVADLPQQQAAQRETQALLGTLTLKLDALRQTAAQASALALAEQHLAEAQAQAGELRARIRDDSHEQAQRLSVLAYEIDAAELAVSKAADAHDKTIRTIRAELAVIPEPGTDEVVAMARQALASAEAQAQAAKTAMDDASAAKAQQEAEIARLKREIAQGSEITSRARALESEIADWTLLCLGLRGVIDLSIEDAGPGIASLANQLLTEAYGPRFSVRIVTQREQANGVTRECFDISVLDAESGLESSILQKSGGESVWIDKALTDAVGLYHQESAGQHYECLFADEAEDGLTQERKTQFYQMDRAALAMGGYRRKYFISHNPEAWAMADHVINLASYLMAA